MLYGSIYVKRLLILKIQNLTYLFLQKCKESLFISKFLIKLDNLNISHNIIRNFRMLQKLFYNANYNQNMLDNNIIAIIIHFKLFLLILESKELLELSRSIDYNTTLLQIIMIPNIAFNNIIAPKYGLDISQYYDILV